MNVDEWPDQQGTVDTAIRDAKESSARGTEPKAEDHNESEAYGLQV